MTMSKDINHLVNMHHHYRSKMMRQQLLLDPDQLPLRLKYHVDGEQECGNFKAYQTTTEHNTLLLIVVNKYYQKL